MDEQKQPMGKDRAALKESEVNQKAELGQRESMLVVWAKDIGKGLRTGDPGLIGCYRIPLIPERQHAPQARREQDSVGREAQRSCRSETANDCSLVTSQTSHPEGLVGQRASLDQLSLPLNG